jgi:hypothetical protein
MSQETIIIELSLEDQRLLVENSVDIVSALRKVGLNVVRAPQPPGMPFSDGGKEPVLTILAIGVTVSLVASGIVKILDALGRNKKTIVTEHELVPVADRLGKPIKDEAGKPVLYWSEKKRLIEAKETTQDKSNSVLAAHAGPIFLKFSTKSGQ